MLDAKDALQAQQLLDQQIRQERENGELLGTLVHRYGAEAVVRVLGVLWVSHILGLDEASSYYEDMDD